MAGDVRVEVEVRRGRIDGWVHSVEEEEMRRGKSDLDSGQ